MARRSFAYRCSKYLAVLTVSAVTLSCSEEQLAETGNAQTSGEEGVVGADTPEPDSQEAWTQAVASVFPDDRVVSLNIEFVDDGLTQMLADWESLQEKTYQQTEISWDGLVFGGSGTRLKGFSTLMDAGGAGGKGGKGGGGGPGGPGGGGGGPGGPGGPDDGTGENPNPGGGAGPQSTLSPTSKLPLKINFDYFGGARLNHIDKVSLGTNAFDTSQMRERLSVNMFRKMGVPAAKTAFAEVSLNGTLVGLYTIVQNINKRFVKQHIGTQDGADDGNLYKCVSLDRHGSAQQDLVCSLRWLGDQRADYYRTEGCATGYSECGLVLKTNEDDEAKNGYSDLIHFLNVLNNSADADFEVAIQEVFDVDSFLRQLAVNVVMVNLDSYLGRINNFYLYHRPDTGKFMMLPWDLNMSYGHYSQVEGLSDMTQYPVQDPLQGRSDRENYVLIERVLGVPTFKAQYLRYVQEFIDGHFTLDVHREMIAQYQTLIRGPVERDPNRSFTMEEFDESLGEVDTGATSAMGSQYNLLDFVARRVAHVQSEL